MKKKTERPPEVKQPVEENRIVNAFLGLANDCYIRAAELKADAYIAHGVEALPAADIVAKTVGGRVYCDVVETPSFAERSVKYDWPPTNMALLNHAFDSYLRHVDGISTIGWAMGRSLEHFGPPVTVLPNYRYTGELVVSQELRDKCRLGPDDALLLASSAICGGFEPVIDALRLLPGHVHLATLGTVVKDYRDQLHSYPVEVGVQDRVHFFDPVPYEDLIRVASSANIALMALDPSLTNDRLSLPNRLFDSIAAGLPIVTPDVPDIAGLLSEHQIGITVPRNEPECWATAIGAALAAEHEMRPRVIAASKQLAWEALTEQLFDAYGRPERVTIFAYSNLVGHQRTLRMADSLIKCGATVTVCCPFFQGDAPQEQKGLKYIFTNHPFSTGNRGGLSKKSSRAKKRWRWTSGLFDSIKSRRSRRLPVTMKK